MNPNRKTSLQWSVRAYAEKGDGPVVKTAPKFIKRGVVGHNQNYLLCPSLNCCLVYYVNCMLNHGAVSLRNR